MRPRAAIALATVALSGALSVLAASCGSGSSSAERGVGPRLDPRVEQLARWAPFRWRRKWRDGGSGGHGGLFFLSRFEFREEDLALVEGPGATTRSEPDLPLASVSLFRAIRLARAFWGRLPTLEEWRGAVQGRAGWLYPWGDAIGNQFAANTARAGLWRRTRVGTFESGRDLSRADSCYDLIGNVAEWTITPYLEVELERLWSRTLDFDALDYRVGVASLGEAVWPDALPDPLWPAGSWAAELEGELVFEERAAQIDFCSIGFSCSQVEPLRPSGKSWEEILGLRKRGARVERWDLGFRMAADPYGILAGLERAGGEPGDADVEALRRFLFQHVEDFRAAARLRARRLGRASLREELGLPEIGAWGRLAYDLLSVRRP